MISITLAFPGTVSFGLHKQERIVLSPPPKLCHFLTWFSGNWGHSGPSPSRDDILSALVLPEQCIIYMYLLHFNFHMFVPCMRFRIPDFSVSSYYKKHYKPLSSRHTIYQGGNTPKKGLGIFTVNPYAYLSLGLWSLLLKIGSLDICLDECFHSEKGPGISKRKKEPLPGARITHVRSRQYRSNSYIHGGR